VIDGWRALGERPVLSYLSDIGAFLPGDRPLFVTPEAHAAAQETAEQFATAWVCDECGEAEDAGVFLWTVRGEGTVRARTESIFDVLERELAEVAQMAEATEKEMREKEAKWEKEEE